MINADRRWPLVRFGDVVRNCVEATREPAAEGLERCVGMEHLEPGSLKIREWGLVAEGTSFSRVFRKGQVLFGKRRAYQRKVAVADFDGICSSDILVFEPKGEELIPELLPFIVQSDGFFNHALGTSAGPLSPRTRWSQLAQYEFSLPPKDEQRRIADVLWAAEETADCWHAARERTRSLVAAVLRDQSPQRSLEVGPCGGSATSLLWNGVSSPIVPGISLSSTVVHILSRRQGMSKGLRRTSPSLSTL